MFGRRKREEQAAESAREAERRALFAELAKRPDSVCPFLGLADNRAGYQPEPNAEHRCYAFGDPAPLSDEQQRHVCLERGYSNCPRYLRGVLVIPTEELEALRRPQPPAAPPPPASPAPAASGGGRRRGLVLVSLLLVLIAAVGAGGWLVLGNPNGIAILFSTTPSPSVTPGETPTALGTPTAVPSPTPFPETPTPGPTVAPTDTFVGYKVVVLEGQNPIFRVDSKGNVLEERTGQFSRFTAAPVKKHEADGLRWWTTQEGTYTGWSYIKDRSGAFVIWKIFRSEDGTEHYEQLTADEV